MLKLKVENGMNSYLNSILEAVPGDIRHTTNEFISEKVSIFEPKEYVIGQTVNLDHYHFIILFSDPPVLKLGNKEFQFHKQRIVVFEPGMDLTVLPFNSGVKADYISISINKAFFEKIALEATEKDKLDFKRLETVYSCQLLDIIRNFKLEIANFGVKYPMMVNSLATQLAFQILRDTQSNPQNYRKIGCNEQKYVNKAIDYMEDNFNSNITLGEISREIYVSQAHFERIFKNYIGKTPHQYLVELRIKKAMELMTREDCSIEEIARRCGFVSLSHFSTVFKRIAGKNASVYKKLLS